MSMQGQFKTNARPRQCQCNFKISGVGNWRWEKRVFAVKKYSNLFILVTFIGTDRDNWTKHKKGLFGLLKCCLNELLIMQIMCFVGNRSLRFFTFSDCQISRSRKVRIVKKSGWRGNYFFSYFKLSFNEVLVLKPFKWSGKYWVKYLLEKSFNCCFIFTKLNHSIRSLNA